VKGSWNRLVVEERMTAEMEELFVSTVARVRANLKVTEVVGGKGIKWYGPGPNTATK